MIPLIQRMNHRIAFLVRVKRHRGIHKAHIIHKEYNYVRLVLSDGTYRKKNAGGK